MKTPVLSVILTFASLHKINKTVLKQTCATSSDRTENNQKCMNYGWTFIKHSEDKGQLKTILVQSNIKRINDSFKNLQNGKKKNTSSKCKPEKMDL